MEVTMWESRLDIQQPQSVENSIRGIIVRLCTAHPFQIYLMLHLSHGRCRIHVIRFKDG